MNATTAEDPTAARRARDVHASGARDEDTEVVSSSMAWISRLVGYVSVTVGILLTAVYGRDPRLLAVQIVGLLVIGVAMTALTLIEARTPPSSPPRPGLYLALGTICAVSGALSMTNYAEWTIVLAGIATMVAGSDIALLPALGITSLGVACTLISAVVVDMTSTAGLIGLPVTIVAGLIIGLRRRSYKVEARQSAVLDERTRIAREIHDVLAHSLGGLGIQIQAARAVLTDSGDIETALSVLSTAQRLASDGLTETRRALHALRTDTLSLDAELRSFAEQHGEMHRAKVDCVITGSVRDLPAAASIALLRVAQEAMVNAAKHGAGAAIGLRLDYGPDRVRLSVVNRMARGHRTQAPAMQTADAGYGLAGMRERLLLIGGSLQAGPDEDGTWTVVAELPHPTTAVRAGTEGGEDER